MLTDFKGSRVYSVHSETSDYDFICVIEDQNKTLPGLTVIDRDEINLGELVQFSPLIGPCSSSNFHFISLFLLLIILDCYSLQYFQQLVKQNVVWAVLCLFLPAEHILKQEIPFEFVLRKPGTQICLNFY